MEEFPKRYEPKEAEPRLQKFWIENNIFKFDQKSKKPVFSIDTPPPTISGKLHIGHAKHYTEFEIIARFRRMQGYNVFFPIGWDNNGQPTERFIETEHKIDLKKISKSDFVELVKREIKKVEQIYKEVFIRLGHSYDWSLLYRTIEDNCAIASQLSFIDLYNKGLMERKEEPTIWCTKCQTALSQADVVDKERTTKMNYLDFESETGERLEIATTRPEFLPATAALFFHPDDERYKKLKGKKAKVPLFDIEVPILTDEACDPSLGTGLMMVCTFGDKADVEKWKIHKLPLKMIITKDGKMNENCGKYSSLSLDDARKEIIKDLEKEGYLKKQEAHEQTVGVCWRCPTPVEFIVTKQWFVKILEHKEELIKQGEKINWHPEFYKKRYADWINNLSWDWLVSRQRHHGIPIPVWYCKKCGKIILPDKEELPVDPASIKKKCECSGEAEPETDVFDTWMTSSLSPEIALGWAEGNKNFEKYFPESLRPQAHDIIRTWAFYTIVKAYYHFRKLPWENIMISGHALDPKGKAMHKSLGNVIEPLEVIDKYCADALRFWAASARLGEDCSFQEKELLSAQKLITKLWNASKFVSMNLGEIKKPKKLKLIDRWMLSKLNKTIKESTESFEKYEYSVPRHLTEQLFWKDFCDNYLEMVKYRLYKGKDDSASYTLYYTLLNILKLFAPIIPHITEEIYQIVFKDYEKKESIHISSWPEPDNIDEEALEIGEMCAAIISGIRQWKHSQKMALNAEIEKVVIECIKEEKLKEVLDDIKGTMKVKKIEFGKGDIEISEGLKIGIK